MKKRNVLYAQSGGVTAVINATAAGVIEAARESKEIGKIYAAKNGILGALKEEIIDTNLESAKEISKLKHTPGGAFGSCRYKLKDPKENKSEYQRLLDIFVAHNIGYFFYNGGGDSQDTANKIANFTKEMGFPVQCIGIPKTVDNDIPFTDNCPGFGSVAKYIAISTKEAGLDVLSMSETSTKVFILEVMGRHAGWIAASSGLAKQNEGDPPHIILFPEITFNKSKMISKVRSSVKKDGYCVIVVSEGVRDRKGNFLADAGTTDAFGHKQLGGVAPQIASIINSSLGYKYHWAVSDYLQRSARHIASQTDLDHAYAVGQAAIKFVLNGENAVMPIIKRGKTKKYSWSIDKVALSRVANKEKKMPRSYISKDGFSITKSCRDYLNPLVQGEAYPPYKNGMPVTASLKNKLVKKKLKNY
ncbi:MAG: 6-phosphofructokinase [Gammaproteobacteria bacterium]